MDPKIVLNLACIVEGQGEVDAVRVLVRQLSEESNDTFWANLVEQPIRAKRSRLVREDNPELNRTIMLASAHLRRWASPKGILVLVDADDDCPAQLGPKLLERAKRIRSDMAVSVVVAKCEYEAWLLAGVEGIRGKRGYPGEIPIVDTPEARRDAKGQLTELLRRNQPQGTYKPTADQAALTQHFDIRRARERSSSFDKLCREIERLSRGERPE